MKAWFGALFVVIFATAACGDDDGGVDSGGGGGDAGSDAAAALVCMETCMMKGSGECAGPTDFVEFYCAELCMENPTQEQLECLRDIECPPLIERAMMGGFPCEIPGMLPPPPEEDAGPGDAGATDAGEADAGEADAGVEDGGAADAGEDAGP